MEEQTAKTRKKENAVSEKVKVNPLRNEIVYVRFVPGNSDLPKNHVMYGRRADGAFTTLVVPMLRNGKYKNILTDAEKEYLEEVLGLDYNALSVYKTENNFWDNYSIRIIAKEGLRLDLSDPQDYIKYKVLLANTDIVAPSVQERIDRPRVTYQFEMVHETEETMLENAKMDATMESYSEFKKIENDGDTVRVLVSLMDGRPYSVNEKRAFLRNRVNALIQKDPKEFLRQITDPLLHTKVLIYRGTELGKISRRGDYYFLASDGSPLCDGGEDPTLSIAARYLNQPSHQDIKFILESELSKNRK